MDSLSVSSARFRQTWYAQQLCAMGEPVLSAPPDGSARVRFLWLRSFDPGIAIRLEKTKDELTMSVVELDGAGGYEPGQVARRYERAVPLSAWGELQDLLAEDGFWRSETSLPSLGTDGAQWIVEVSEPDRYHVVDRWGKGRIGEFLIGLSGLQPERIY